LDKPSLRLAQDDEALEEMGTTHTSGAWELYIVNHLMACCGVGDLKWIDTEVSTGTESDFEDGSIGYDEDKPAPVAKPRKEKRRRNQKEKKGMGNVLLQRYNGMAG